MFLRRVSRLIGCFYLLFNRFYESLSFLKVQSLQLVLEQGFPTGFAWRTPDIKKAETPIIHPAVHVSTKIISFK